MANVGDEPKGPKYRLLAAAIRKKILAGEYAPGSKLPSETELMEAWGAARGTVRQALAVLGNEGLTESRKGSGVRVRDVAEYRALHEFKPIVRVETTRGSAWRLGRSMWEYDLGGRELSNDQLKVGYADAPDRIAHVLETADTGYRSRRYSVDKRPGLLSKSYLPSEIVRGTRIMEPDTGPGGTYARLRDLGFEIAGFRMQVWAREAAGDEAGRLGLVSSSWVLCGVRTAFIESGRAVEVNDMVMSPSMFVLQFDWDA
jgi:GntR family transcriptional regulator